VFGFLVICVVLVLVWLVWGFVGWGLCLVVGVLVVLGVGWCGVICGVWLLVVGVVVWVVCVGLCVFCCLCWVWGVVLVGFVVVCWLFGWLLCVGLVGVWGWGLWGGWRLVVCGGSFGRSAAVLGAGVDVGLSDSLSVGLSFVGQVSNDASFVSLYARVTLEF
ncbi:hypothetical protein RA279_27780, partial [Pseudomonas syringae pv. tagetis]|uniref:hypothetical protein n=1 Tax=Pseudomonas syringae group genomosp. 7 TaxID=251699 RepID=UPI00376FC27D